jgi:predicted small metal-binding protein
VPVHGEVGKREPPLSAWKLTLEASSVDPHHEPAAKLDPRLRQAFDKVTASPAMDNPHHGVKTEEGSVSKVINCECGEVVRAESDDELVQKVERHVGDAHPELVGKMSRADVLGMAEEE